MNARAVIRYRVSSPATATASSKTRTTLIYGMIRINKSLDLRILNSCTVKDPSEQVFRNLVDEGLKKGKKVVVAGCVPQGMISNDR